MILFCPRTNAAANRPSLAGKVLFGSDFPNTPYPFAEQMEALQSWDLGEDWLRAVLWENGASLFDPAEHRKPVEDGIESGTNSRLC